MLFRCHDASGERYFVKEYTLVADTWKHVEMVVPGDSNLVFNADNGEGLEMRWILAAGDDRNDATADTWFAPGSDYDNSTSNQVNFYDSTSNNFFLTGVQLEVGDQATNFEHLPFDVQLQRCQRYYQRLTGAYVQYGQILNGHYNGDNQLQGVYTYPVKMRTGPSLVHSTTSSNNSASAYAIATNGGVDYIDSLLLYNPNDHATLIYTGSGTASGSSGNAGNLHVQANVTEAALSAEL